MISLESILEWKQKYGDIYQLEILGQHFIFRPLGREEYKQIILMDFTLAEFQEIISNTAIIYPDQYDFTKGLAGVAEVLSDAVLDVSGLLLGQAAELLQLYREEMLNYDYQVDCLIHEAFPEYTLEEISTWPVRKTMYYLSRSEWVLKTLKGVPLEYVDSAVNYEEEYMEPEPQQQVQQQQMPEEQTPYQRPIRKELIEGPEPPKEKPPMEKPQQQQGNIDSEEAVLAMLAGVGNVSKPITNMQNERIPELNWFSYMDELKGEFD